MSTLRKRSPESSSTLFTPSGKNLTASRRFRLAFHRNVDWDKEEILTLLFWFRLIIAGVLGLVWGLLSVTGLPGHIAYVAISSVAIHVYYTKYLGLDDEDYGRWALLGEGFMPSFALFNLIWISVYSSTL